MLEDSQILEADTEAVIIQFEPYLQKLASKYIHVLGRTGAVDMDDLIQAGRIATATAQKRYDPDRGSFLNCLYFYARKAMRNTLGYNSKTGEAPEALLYLDAPISEDKDTSLGDTIPDPDGVPMDEPIIEEESRRETSEQIHAALDRLKSDKQREAITRIHLDGQDKASAAADMGVSIIALRGLDRYAMGTLRRDIQLRRYAETVPFIHVGVSRFNTTWTSATEAAVLWRLEHLPQV